MTPRERAAVLAARYGTQIFLPGDALDVQYSTEYAALTPLDGVHEMLERDGTETPPELWEELAAVALPDTISDGVVQRLLDGIEGALDIIAGRPVPPRFVLQPGHFPPFADAVYHRPTSSIVLNPYGATALPELHQQLDDIINRYAEALGGRFAISTYSPVKTVLHELGHWLDPRLHERDDLLSWLQHFVSGVPERLYARYRSLYTSTALREPTEFVAETFATEMLTPGAVPDFALAYYRALGGPELSTPVLAAA